LYRAALSALFSQSFARELALNMSLRSHRTLAVVVALVAVACGAVAGCSGSDFSAGPSAGAGGELAAGAGGVTLGGDSGRAGGDSAGSVNANAGHAGLGTGGNAAGGALGVGEAGVAGQSGGTGGTGEAGASSGGSSGSGVSEAGEGGAAGCAPVSWFPDGDGDGYGRSSGQVVACDPPTTGKWVRQGGDCDDDNDAVSPGETQFESSGYTSASSSISFDYDCSGIEEPDPSQLGAAPNCASMLLSCAGSGFVATARSGPGVNSLCGSTSIVKCTKVSLSCTSVVSVVAVSDGFRCH
jgi:hypothetical protein